MLKDFFFKNKNFVNLVCTTATAALFFKEFIFNSKHHTVSSYNLVPFEVFWRVKNTFIFNVVGFTTERDAIVQTTFEIKPARSFKENFLLFTDLKKNITDSYGDFSTLGSGLFEQDLVFDLTIIHTQFIVMTILASVLYFLSKIFSKKIFNLEKKSAYECGFEPFLILTTFIEVGFILVAFIFLIFDLELIFLSGFLVSSGSIGSGGILLVITYLSSVWVMVFFEIFSGVLSWPVWNIFKTKANFSFYSIFTSLQNWREFFFFITEVNYFKKLKFEFLKAHFMIQDSSEVSFKVSNVEPKTKLASRAYNMNIFEYDPEYDPSEYIPTYSIESDGIDLDPVFALSLYDQEGEEEGFGNEDEDFDWKLQESSLNYVKQTLFPRYLVHYLSAYSDGFFKKNNTNFYEFSYKIADEPKRDLVFESFIYLQMSLANTTGGGYLPHTVNTLNADLNNIFRFLDPVLENNHFGNIDFVFSKVFVAISKKFPLKLQECKPEDIVDESSEYSWCFEPGFTNQGAKNSYLLFDVSHHINMETEKNKIQNSLLFKLKTKESFSDLGVLNSYFKYVATTNFKTLDLSAKKWELVKLDMKLHH